MHAGGERFARYPQKSLEDLRFRRGQDSATPITAVQRAEAVAQRVLVRLARSRPLPYGLRASRAPRNLVDPL